MNDIVVQVRGVFSDPLYAAIITSCIGLLLNIAVLFIAPAINRSSSRRYKKSLRRRLVRYSQLMDFMRRGLTSAPQHISLSFITLFVGFFILQMLVPLLGEVKERSSLVTMGMFFFQAAAAFVVSYEIMVMQRRYRFYAYPARRFDEVMEEVDSGKKSHLLTTEEREAVLTLLTAWKDEMSYGKEFIRDAHALHDLEEKFAKPGSLLQKAKEAGPPK